MTFAVGQYVGSIYVFCVAREQHVPCEVVESSCHEERWLVSQDLTLTFLSYMSLVQ